MGDDVEIGALALNVAIPPALRWEDERRGESLPLFGIEALTSCNLPIIV